MTLRWILTPYRFCLEGDDAVVEGASVEQAANAEDGAAASPTGRRPLTVTSMAQHEPNPVEPRNEILEALRQLLDERKQKRSPGSDTASWNSRQGPEKHVKWRGGAAPVPPQWKPQQNDLRAFARWETPHRDLAFTGQCIHATTGCCIVDIPHGGSRVGGRTPRPEACS